MKNTVKRISLIILSLLMLSGLFVVSAGADTLDDNSLLRNDKYKVLSDLTLENLTNYGDIGSDVNMFIDIYEKKLNSLKENDLAKPETKEVIELYYEQGIAAGKIALIYYPCFFRQRLLGID